MPSKGQPRGVHRLARDAYEVRKALPCHDFLAWRYALDCWVWSFMAVSGSGDTVVIPGAI